MKKTVFVNLVKIALVLALVCVLGTTETVFAQSGPTLNDYTVGLVKGKTFTLKLDGGKAVSFVSKDSKIAKVDAKGVIKGVKPGVTSVVVTDANGKTFEAEVTVISKADAKKKVPASLEYKNIDSDKNANVVYNYYFNGERKGETDYDKDGIIVYSRVASYDMDTDVETVLVYGKDDVYSGKEMYYYDGLFGEIILAQSYDKNDKLDSYYEIEKETDDDVTVTTTNFYEKNKKGKFKCSYTYVEEETPDYLITSEYEKGELVSVNTQYLDEEGRVSDSEAVDADGNIINSTEYKRDDDRFLFYSYNPDDSLEYWATGYTYEKDSDYYLGTYASFASDDSKGNGHLGYFIAVDLDDDSNVTSERIYTYNPETGEYSFSVYDYKLVTLKKYFETIY